MCTVFRAEGPISSLCTVYPYLPHLCTSALISFYILSFISLIFISPHLSLHHLLPLPQTLLPTSPSSSSPLIPFHILSFLFLITFLPVSPSSSPPTSSLSSFYPSSPSYPSHYISLIYISPHLFLHSFLPLPHTLLHISPSSSSPLISFYILSFLSLIYICPHLFLHSLLHLPIFLISLPLFFLPLEDSVQHWGSSPFLHGP